ncbi:MAG: helix-turn-helix transcriptional regulator [Moorea sp. SIO3I7]|uniref:helix-turn-helix domain-containing protein n=1 Tax=Moorena sp. SIO3I8 TaxID=2607833 RepID=UPI0013C14BD0|nr:helix-turn-helix transcriptional regulator [Moorena sp. SIO3I8]NEN99101.1 helix-turn-helix transcriptional regulator [Moorena sp. SIO3I7]NEO07209.1 helix-turn-helix transcriptional regulator [Moorena sp. SIO3I8]NEO47923.1 helix-turn-helix transcriptional regulator [Moorena sp. SIO4A3]
MKVTTKLAQLRANSGNISYEEISESTGIDRQQLRELENGEANAMKRSQSVAYGLSFR